MSTVQFKRHEGKAVRNGDTVGYWEMEVGDTAQPLIMPRSSDKSVQIIGAPWSGGASVSMLCTNDPDMADDSWEAMYDPFDTDIVQTSRRKPWTMLPNVYAIKPNLDGGDGDTRVKICIVGRGDRE